MTFVSDIFAIFKQTKGGTYRQENKAGTGALMHARKFYNNK